MVQSFHVPRFNSKTRSLILLGTDAVIAGASLVTAFLLRFDGNVPAGEWERFFQVLPMLLGARSVASLAFRLNRWSFRFSGLTDGARVGMAGLFGTGLWALALFLVGRAHGLSRAVVVIELLLSTLLMAALRFMPRLIWMYRADLLRARRPRAVRTLIVGAGTSGEMLARDLQRSTDHDYQVLGFVDDDPELWGDLVGGRSILGGISDIPNLAKRFGLELVLIAIPNLSADRLRSIVAYCTELGLRFKILPASMRHLPSTASLLQNLAPCDVLERDEVTFRHDGASSFSPERAQLVAGAAGSIGSEVSAQLLEVGCRHLVMVDINENGLYLLKRRFERLYPDRHVVAEVADIRDAPRVASLFAKHRPADVFHAAACKHVTLMEDCVAEAVKTNVAGTGILARAAHDFAARRFVFMSTDKAVHPTSVMGATKRLGELYVRWMDERSETRFSVVRFGNVFDSSGSVVPVFREQIRAGGPVTVTHPEARRFFMTISEAVGLVLRAAYGDFGQLCVLEMGEPVRILDLARDLISMSGLIPEDDVPIRFVGLGPGEKLLEELLARDEVVLGVVDGKVRIVAGPPPPADVSRFVDALAAAAAREDTAACLRELRQAVGDFGSPPATANPGRVPTAAERVLTSEAAVLGSALG